MIIRLTGWENSGLRCPDIKVNLADGEKVPKVVLLQMPNGTGKTTTLNLILAAMTGTARAWSTEQVRALQRPQATNPNGSFTLRLQVDGKPLVFMMNFDFVEGIVHYRTSSHSLGGVVEGWSCPPLVKRFLTTSFSSLFVFDGEFAHKLLDAQEAEAERAIDALCQIDLLDYVGAVAEADWKSATKGQAAKTTQGLAIYENKKDALQKRERDLTTARKRLKAENEVLSGEVEKLEKKLAEKLSSNQQYREEFEQLYERVSTATSSLSRSGTHLMGLLRCPHLIDERIGHALMQFKGSLDRARLPETSSRQFFTELADEIACICGRPIGETERNAIRDHASHYLGDDLAGVINSIKLDIGNHLGVPQTVDRKEYTDAVSGLADVANEYHLATTALEALKANAFSDDDGEEELRATQDDIGRKRKTIAENQDLVDEIGRSAQASDDENSSCLASISKQLRDVTAKIAEISNTVRLRRETDAIQSLARQAKEIARARLREVLRTECNQRLRRVLAGDPIQIRHIGQSLQLESQAGASVGQTLAVGYTFLASVLHRGSNEFPLIVDSPAGPLDDHVRREVGSMIPELCDQFTAFMISSERPYFLPALEKSAKKDIKYLTMFRKTPGTASLVRSLPREGVAQTANAVIVEGREYFNSFELLAEPEDN